ncbi:hypothetical protein GCM10022284_64130 [Streptomyces hundungensis]
MVWGGTGAIGMTSPLTVNCGATRAGSYFGTGSVRFVMWANVRQLSVFGHAGSKQARETAPGKGVPEDER